VSLKIKERNRADLLADEVRDQEDDNENMDEQIVETKAA